jgi:hypothetical protein
VPPVQVTTGLAYAANAHIVISSPTKRTLRNVCNKLLVIAISPPRKKLLFESRLARSISLVSRFGKATRNLRTKKGHVMPIWELLPIESLIRLAVRSTSCRCGEQSDNSQLAVSSKTDLSLSASRITVVTLPTHSQSLIRGRCRLCSSPACGHLPVGGPLRKIAKRWAAPEGASNGTIGCHSRRASTRAPGLGLGGRLTWRLR